MTMYNRGKRLKRDWAEASKWKVLLVTDSYTPNVDHDTVDDADANEATGTGYSRKTLANCVQTVDDTNDRVDHDADNVTWTSMTSSFRYAIVFYDPGTGDANTELHSYYDLKGSSGNLTINGDYTIKWNGGSTAGTVFRGT